jgi:zinc transporter ZupT
VAAIATYLIGSSENMPLGVLLGLSAGFLLYIASSDVIPTIHSHYKNKSFFNTQALLLILGVIIVGLLTSYTHSYIADGHQHEDETHINKSSLDELHHEYNKEVH